MNNNKNFAAQALLEMDAINESLKKQSESTLKNLLAESVKDALRSSIEDDEYVILEAKKGAESEDKLDEIGEQDQEVPAQAEAEVAQPEEAAADNGEGAEDEEMPQDAGAAEEAPTEEPGNDADMEQYKVDGEDNTYDLRGAKGEDVIKVFKKLNNDDQVVVKQNGSQIELNDNETGAEYVIDLGGEDEEMPEAAEGEAAPEAEEMPASEGQEELNEMTDFDLSSSEEDPILGSQEEDLEEPNIAGFESQDGQPEMPFQNENKKNKKKTMKESKNDVLFEIDLGYTDNYQGKDPINGLSATEPSKSGKSWHKGIPTGTEKPWAGKGTDKKGDPFAEAVNEEFEEGCEEACDNLEEGSTTTAKAVRRHMTKNHIPNNPDNEDKPFVSKVNSVAGELKQLTAENKELRKAVSDLRTSLNEAYMTNVNLGKITKLFLENSTTKAEKVAIIERFANEAKTADQSKKLFESIDKQLKSNKQNASTIAESKQPKTTTVITEEKSKDLLDTIDFMKRVMSC